MKQSNDEPKNKIDKYIENFPEETTNMLSDIRSIIKNCLWNTHI